MLMEEALRHLFAKGYVHAHVNWKWKIHMMSVCHTVLQQENRVSSI